MYQGNRVGVVVPVYNEAAFVGDVLDDLPAFVDRAYPVDDSSTDRTWEVIRRRVSAEAPVDRRPVEAGATETETTADGGRAVEPTVVPIRHETNRGRGGAVKTGYLAALDDGMDVVAAMDADGQMDPELLDSLLDPVVAGEADYAKGNRLATPELREEMSSWRLFGNSLLTGLTRVASGYWGMSDPQNGYTAISSDLLRALDIESLYEGYGFLNDVLVRLSVHDARVVDVPMSAVYGDEESGIEYTTFVPLLSLLLVSRFLWRLRSEYLSVGPHPVAVVYGLAGASGVGGLGYTVQSVVTRRALGPVAALVAIALCPVLVVAAFLLERRYNSDLEPDHDSDSDSDIDRSR